MASPRYRPRIPLDAIQTRHACAEQALHAGDFTWVARFGREDRSALGAALVLLGNTRGGLRVLEALASSSPRDALFRAIAHWLQDETASASAALQGLATAHPLVSALRRQVSGEPLRVRVFSQGDPGRFAHWKRSRAVSVETAAFHTAGADHELDFGRANPLAAAARADTDLLLLDNLHVHPGALHGLPGLKAATCADVEWSYGDRIETLAALDALVLYGSSQTHHEMQARFGRPTFVSYAYLNALVTPEEGFKTSAEDGRVYDVFFSGRIRHNLGFYPDKRHRLLGIAQVDARYRVRLIERFLDDGTYSACLRRARFVPISLRHTLGITPRALEALAHGAFVLTNEDSALASLFSRDYGACFPYADESITRDVERHLDAYPEYRREFLEGAAELADELASLMPPASRAAEKALKTYWLLAMIGRHGFPGASVTPSPPRPASRALTPMVHAHFCVGHDGRDAAVRSLQSCLETTRTTGEGHASRVSALCLENELAQLGARDDLRLLRATEALLAERPDSVLLGLRRLVCLAQTGAAAAELESLHARAVAGPARAPDPDELRMSWRESLPFAYALVDAGIAEAVSEGAGAWRAGRPSTHAVCEGLACETLARAWLREGDPERACAWARRSLERTTPNPGAAGVLLGSLLTRKDDRSERDSETEFLSAFAEHASVDWQLLTRFASQAIEILDRRGDARSALALLRRWLTVWSRMLFGAAAQTLDPESARRLRAWREAGRLEALLDELADPEGPLERALGLARLRERVAGL